MKRTLIATLLALALVAIPVGSALAAPTEEVEITADPTWAISITTAPDAWALGAVDDDNTIYWWNGVGEPAWPLTDADAASTITNDGTVEVDIAISGEDFAGGVGWTLVNSLTPGVDEADLVAWAEGNVLNEGIVLLNLAANPDFIDDLDETLTIDWEMRLITADAFTDAVSKSSTVTLTATQSLAVGPG